MITDTAGTQLLYWPISGLVEGQVSETLHFIVQDVDPRSRIVSSPDHRVRVWCRRHGAGSFTDISATPLLNIGIAGNQQFDIYVEALTPISGLERVPIKVSCGMSKAAGWADGEFEFGFDESDLMFF